MTDRTYMKLTLLLLLMEREGHGYELVTRMVELGLDPGPTGTVYRLLRIMETETLVTSAWDIAGAQGPARRIYQVTTVGEESLPVLMQELFYQHRTINTVVGLYEVLWGSTKPFMPVMASGEPAHS